MSQNVAPFVILALPLVIALCLPLIWLVIQARFRRGMRDHQENEAATRAGILRYQQFNGTPFVTVAPTQWQLDPQRIRQLAYEQGYLEIQPAYAGCLSFQRVKPVPSPGFTPLAIFDHPENTVRPNRETWLVNRISGSEQTWVSVKHAKISRQNIEEIAARHGMRVAWAFGDYTDQVLWLSRERVALSLPIPKPTGLKRFRPSFFCYLLALTVIVGGVMSGAIYAQLGYTRLSGIPLPIGFALVLPSLWSLRVFPRSARARMLAKEFNGANGVPIFLSLYGFSEQIVAQIGGTHGYFYGKQSSNQAQGRLLTFVKNVR